MRNLWKIILSLVFITLVACSNKNEESVEDKQKNDTEQNEVAKEDAKEEASENSTSVEYDESKKETKVMKMNRPGIEGTIEFIHSDDVLLEQLQTTKIFYEAAGLENEEEAKAQVKELGDEEKYKDQEGIKYRVEYDKDSYTEIFKVDFTEADLSLVSSIPADVENANRYVSYQNSIDNFKKQGYYLEGETATEVFSTEKEGYIYEVELKHKGNKVLKQTTFNEQTYETLGFKDKKQAKEELNSISKLYDQLNKEEGVNFELEFLDDKFTVNGEMDYRQMKNIDKVVEMMSEGEQEAGSAELVQNYSVVASSFLSSGLQHIETKKED